MTSAKFNLGIGLIRKYGMRYESNENDANQKQKLIDALIVMKMVQTDGLAYQINPFLFIGSIGCAYNQEELIRHEITHIICATPKAKEMFTQSITYHRIDIEDTLQEEITSILHPFLVYVDSVRSSNDNSKVLIHCFQGKSRASSLCVAYIMHCAIRDQERLFNEDDIRDLFCSSLDIVRTCRSIVCPNDSFRRQIIAFFQKRSSIHREE